MPDKNELEASTYMQTQRRQALAVLTWWSNRLEEDDYMGARLLELRIQAPKKTGQDFRLVLKGVTEAGQYVVAFGNGGDMQSALASLKSRAEAQGMPWRDDKPYTPPSAQ